MLLQGHTRTQRPGSHGSRAAWLTLLHTSRPWVATPGGVSTSGGPNVVTLAAVSTTLTTPATPPGAAAAAAGAVGRSRATVHPPQQPQQQQYGLPGLDTPTLLSDFDEPSADLREMCVLQLEMLHQLLSNAGEAYRELRMYVRLPSSLGSTSVQLRKVACIGFMSDTNGTHGCSSASGLIRMDGPEDMVVLSMNLSSSEDVIGRPGAASNSPQPGSAAAANAGAAAAAAASERYAAPSQDMGSSSSSSSGSSSGSGSGYAGFSRALGSMGGGESMSTMAALNSTISLDAADLETLPTPTPIPTSIQMSTPAPTSSSSSSSSSMASSSNSSHSQAVRSSAHESTASSSVQSTTPHSHPGPFRTEPASSHPHAGHSRTDATFGGAGSSARGDAGPGPAAATGAGGVVGWEAMLQQDVLVLPQSGTHVVPLLEQGLLVGLLVMDKGSSTQDAGATHAQDSMGGAGASSADGRGLPALRLAAPALAKACALHLKMSLQSMQLAAQTDTARGLLRDIQRRASALNTFSAMLLPRMTAGQPDQDLAQGMALQGKRLQELLRQLDSALSRPALPPSPLTSGSAAPSPSAGPAWLPGVAYGLDSGFKASDSGRLGSSTGGTAIGGPPVAAGLTGARSAGAVSAPPVAAAPMASSAGAVTSLGTVEPRLPSPVATSHGSSSSAMTPAAPAMVPTAPGDGSYSAGTRSRSLPTGQGQAAGEPAIIAGNKGAPGRTPASLPGVVAATTVAAVAANATLAAATTVVAATAANAQVAASASARTGCGGMASTSTSSSGSAGGSGSVTGMGPGTRAKSARAARREERNARLRNRAPRLGQSTGEVIDIEGVSAVASTSTSTNTSASSHSVAGDAPSASNGASNGNGRSSGGSSSITSLAPTLALVPLVAPTPAAITPATATTRLPPGSSDASSYAAASNSSSSIRTLPPRPSPRATPAMSSSATAIPATSVAAPPAAATTTSALGSVNGDGITSPARCSVSEALAGLLDAVVRLAGLSGVRVIVQPPLVAHATSPAASTHTSSHPASADAQASLPLSQRRGSSLSPPIPGPMPSLHTSASTEQSHAGVAGVSCGACDTAVVLGPRPVRQIEAAVPAMTLRRIMSYLLDIVLQCTPRGGQVCISAQLNSPQNDPGINSGGASSSSSRSSARGMAPAGNSSSGGSCSSTSSKGKTSKAGSVKGRGGGSSGSKAFGGAGWVQLLIIHSGSLAVDRLHLPSQQLSAAAGKPSPPPRSVLLRRPRMPDSSSSAPSHAFPMQLATTAVTGDTRELPHGASMHGGTMHGSVPRAPGMAGAETAAGRAAGAIWPALPGSGLVSFSMAEQLVQAVGGYVQVSQQVPMVNATSGSVEAATCIEVLLPGCGPA